MGGWRVLTLRGRNGDGNNNYNNNNNNNKPTLLVKHAFEDTRYAVYLTDLVHIWGESLDRRSVIKRALIDGSSIDPSEGADQLKLLLNHIHNALDGVHGRLSLGAAAAAADGGKSGCLELEIEVDLPVPLEPLKWTMSLEQKPGDAMFEQLQVPLFQTCFRREAEVDTLQHCIAEKDAVIARLVDKLESSGADLASIFPGAGRARGSGDAVREQLYRAVPALKPFDKALWVIHISGLGWKSKEELLDRAFSGATDVTRSEELHPPEEWWKRLSAGGEMLQFPKDGLRTSLSSAQPQLDAETSMVTEDDFQIQDVSKLSRNQDWRSRVQVKDSQAPSHPKPYGEGEDSTTEDDDDEDDLDAPAVSPPHPAKPAKSPVTSPIKPPPSTSRKLGMLGGGGGAAGKTRQPAKSPSPTPESMDVMDTGGSSHDLFVPNSVPEPANRTTTKAMAATTTTAAKVAPAKKKIGRIGGLLAKPYNGDSSPLELPLRSPSQEEMETLAGEDSGGHDRRASRPLAKGQSSDAAKRRETSTERADRKRRELKRELEEKRNAPAKRKRKF